MSFFQNINPHWSRLLVPAALLSLIAALLFLLTIFNVRFNFTSSEPKGIYRMLPVSTGIHRGDLVEFCYVGEPNKFMLNGDCANGTAPFLKQVAGMPGDTIILSDDGVEINGKHLDQSKPLRAAIIDPSVLLPVLRGTFVLKDGEYWVYGSGYPSRSFDSRYFGAVYLKNIRSVRHA